MDTDATQLGAELRKLWIAKKKSLTQTNYRLGPRWDTEDLWRKAGEKCLELKASPIQLIAAAFMFDRNPQGPFPNILIGKAINFKWNTYLGTGAEETKNPLDKSNDESADEMLQQVSYWMDILEGATGELGFTTKNKAELMNHNGIYIPPWMRIVLSNGDVDVVRVWEKEARADLLDPELDLILSRAGYKTQLWLQWMQ